MGISQLEYPLITYKRCTFICAYDRICIKVVGISDHIRRKGPYPMIVDMLAGFLAKAYIWAAERISTLQGWEVPFRKDG